MVANEIPMDEQLYERYRSLIEKNDGYAQNADALLRQVEETMAREPVCTFVTRDDTMFQRMLLPFLVKNNWVLRPIRSSMRIDDSTVVPYFLITITGPKRK